MLNRKLLNAIKKELGADAYNEVMTLKKSNETGEKTIHVLEKKLEDLYTKIKEDAETVETCEKKLEQIESLEIWSGELEAQSLSLINDELMYKLDRIIDENRFLRALIMQSVSGAKSEYLENIDNKITPNF